MKIRHTSYCTRCGNFWFIDIEDRCYYCNSKMQSTEMTSDEWKNMTDKQKEQDYRNLIINKVFTSQDFDINKWNDRARQEKKFNEIISSPLDYIHQNVPKCPTCGSTNLSKVGTGERVVSVGLLGLFSGKINKTFKCKNCGYTW